MREFIMKHNLHLIFYLDKVARRKEVKDLNIDKICEEYQCFVPTKYDKLPTEIPSLPDLLEAVENAMVTLCPYPDKGNTEEVKEYIKNYRVVECYAHVKEEKKFKMRFKKAIKLCQEFQKNHNDVYLIFDLNMVAIREVYLIFYLNMVAIREDMKTYSLFSEIDNITRGSFPIMMTSPKGFHLWKDSKWLSIMQGKRAKTRKAGKSLVKSLLK